MIPPINFNQREQDWMSMMKRIFLMSAGMKNFLVEKVHYFSDLYQFFKILHFSHTLINKIHYFTPRLISIAVGAAGL